MRPPRRSTLFPYTTLFRSRVPVVPSVQRRPFGFPKRQARSAPDRKSTRLNSSHLGISYAVFCLKKKKTTATSQSDSRDSILHTQHEQPRITTSARPARRVT